ncbi:hypothetical protein QOT17_007358 [Balamuthia mandrillaris]
MELRFLLIIIMAVAGGVSAAIHTAYFLYKMINSGRTKNYYALSQAEAQQKGYDDSCCGGVIELNPTEVSLCMGYLWNTCTDHGAMKKTTFIFWYFFVLFFDCALTVGVCLFVNWRCPSDVYV